MRAMTEIAKNENDLKNRRIRSFVLRQGRVTKGQERALETQWPKYGVEYGLQSINLNTLFDRGDLSDQNALSKSRKKILEIGFGMGETTAKIAQTLPNYDFLAAEVHTPGVGALLKLIEELALTNIRIIQHDVVEVLENMLADASLDGVHIFFPDPWHKKRHHKRRLIQTDFVKLLCSKLKMGAYLHVATDWQEYADWALDILTAEPQLKNTAIKDNNGYAKKPSYRPLTKFENRGIKLGHGVWDMVFTRI